jgi:hypothetical protein
MDASSPASGEPDMSNTRWMLALVSLAALLAAPPSGAQSRGTTTGPEGSEIGKGGYVPASGGPGSFSLQLDGGGAFPVEGSFSPPLFVGATATYWGTEYYRLDLSGAFIPATDAVDVWQALVGPSFRTISYPLGFSLGLQAGVQVPTEGDTRFVLSPRAGIDFLVEERILVGLSANYDFVVDDNDRSIVRTYLSVGYRF